MLISAWAFAFVGVAHFPGLWREIAYQAEVDKEMAGVPIRLLLIVGLISYCAASEEIIEDKGDVS